MLAGHLLGWRPRCAVEFDSHGQAVLLARQRDGLLPAFPIWDDIRTFDGRQWAGSIDVVTGGFPCQAFSTAARGRNTADDLWPEMRRVVAEVSPSYVFAENVSRAAIDAAADDLEAMGYETRAVSLGAADLGGDHVRERYWLLAYADDESELLRGLDAEVARSACLSHRVWTAEPGEPRMADGMAGRVERYRATGNGWVPVVAVAALVILTHNAELSGAGTASD